jgi:orotidine-5'-phosphate decarboxylase
MSKLEASQRIIMAIDTTSEGKARELAEMARDAGARYIKLGLQLLTATDPRFCSLLAERQNLGWVMDAKLDDIPNTVAEATQNLVNLKHPPMGITIHTAAGHEAMSKTQTVAGSRTRMLGVTILTSAKDLECYRLYGPLEDQEFPEEVLARRAVGFRQKKVMQLARRAAQAGLAGAVASPLEVGSIKTTPETSRLFTMIPGIRPAGTAAGDQGATGTPEAAILAGADLLVVGRPIYEAPNPAYAFEQIALEVEGALGARL